MIPPKHEFIEERSWQLLTKFRSQSPCYLLFAYKLVLLLRKKRVPAGRVMKLWRCTAVKTGHATSDAVPCTLSPPNTFVEQTAGSRTEIRSSVGVGLVH